MVLPGPACAEFASQARTLFFRGARFEGLRQDRADGDGFPAGDCDALGRRRCLVRAQAVEAQPLLQRGHGVEEAIAAFDQQVDVVDVPAAAETVGQIVARIDGGQKLVAVRADEVSRTEFAS